MKKISRFKEENNQSYWQSTTDVMTGLLLMLLLIMMLFMVRILYFSEYDGTGDKTGEGNYLYENGYNHPEGNDYVSLGGTNSSSGDGENNKNYDEEGGDYEEKENFINEPLAAVYIKLQDEDSLLQVNQGGVEFELRNTNNAVISLTTYYPQKETYRVYKTEEDGTFYLPQKLKEGTYVLKNLTNAEGYGLAQDVSFTVDKNYEWSNPLTVISQIGVEKNNLYVQLVDSNNFTINEPALINVYAYDDIVTHDGTLRYLKNELVDTIECNDRGYGVSKELFLGDYLLELNFDEGCYASTSQNVAKAVSKSAENSNYVNRIVAQKTAIEIQLADELNGLMPLSGVEYELRNVTTNETIIEATDYSGYLKFTDLNRNTKYEIRQINTISSYYDDDEVHVFEVDSDGLINGEATALIRKTNRTIRISINIIDAYLRKQISGLDVNIYNSAGEKVLNYRTDEYSKNIEGLKHGTYTIEIEKYDVKETVVVENKAENQPFTISIKIQNHLYIAIAILVAFLMLLAVLVKVLLKKKRKESK